MTDDGRERAAELVRDVIAQACDGIRLVGRWS